MSADKYREIKS